MENKFVAKFFQDIDDDVLQEFAILQSAYKRRICKIVIKGIYVNFIYWSKCEMFCLRVDPTCTYKSITTQW